MMRKILDNAIACAEGIVTGAFLLAIMEMI